MELTTDQKGSIAEAAIVLEAAKLGIAVFRPVTDGHRYDLIFDLSPQLLRVQCKWAVRDGDVVIVGCHANRRTREGLRRRCYTAEEIDAVAAYCPQLERCYFIPASRVDGRAQIMLRLAPSRNNQRLGINWAQPFEFSSINWAELDQLGAIAQLGERRHGMAEVVGSSPTSSTS